MVPSVNRRSFLKGVGAATGAAGLTGMAGCLGDDGGIEDETLTIGVLQPTSGDLAYYGEHSMMGFFSGLAYKYDLDPPENLSPGTRTLEPDDGPEIELIVEDTEADADTAQTVAENLVLDDEVDLLFGTTSSSSARQVVQQVVAAEEIPFLIGPAADENITNSSEFCHPYAFRASEHTGMDARAGGVYAAQEAGVSQVAIFYADYSFGQSVRDNYRAVLEAEGIEVSPVRGVPQGHDEFDGLFEEAVNDGAEAVVGGFTVATLPQFLTSAFAFDVQIFGAFATLFTAQVMGDLLDGALGEGWTEEDVREAGIGPLTSRYHWNQYSNDINDAFIDMHVDAYDQVPDLFSSGTFTAASALVQAAESAGSIDPDDLVDELAGMTVEETPKGEDGYVFQEHNNQAASDMTVCWPAPTSDEWAESWPAGTMPGEPVQTVPADDVMTPVEDATCDLA
ncbi:MAG: ABC transporter substrate-binding protein [Halobacteriota archaeon]